MESKGLKHLRLRGGLREKRLFFSRQKTYPRNGIRLQSLQIRRIKIKQATSFGVRFFGLLVKLLHIFYVMPPQKVTDKICAERAGAEAHLSDL